MLCDMHCNTVQRREHVHETRRHERKSAQASSGQRTRVLAYCDRVHYCAQVSRAARMEDYHKSDGSHSFSTVLPLSLLGWYGSDLSLKRSRSCGGAPCWDGHVLRMINNKGRMKHTGIPIGKEASSNHLVKTYALFSLKRGTQRT